MLLAKVVYSLKTYPTAYHEGEKQSEGSYLLSQSEQNIYMYVVVLCFLQVFSSLDKLCIYSVYLGKKGRRFQLCHQFWAVFLLSQDVVMSYMSWYIELDRHS